MKHEINVPEGCNRKDIWEKYEGEITLKNK